MNLEFKYETTITIIVIMACQVSERLFSFYYFYWHIMTQQLLQLSMVGKFSHCLRVFMQVTGSIVAHNSVTSPTVGYNIFWFNISVIVTPLTFRKRFF